MTHDARHELVLERIMVGELDESSAEARARLEECSDCRGELARLRALDQRLGGLGRRQREDLAQARRLATAEDAARVSASLQGMLARRAPPRTGRLFLWLAAAGVLLLSGYLAFRATREDAPARPADILLGGQIPLVVTGDFSEITWAFEGDATFVLEVHRAVEQAGGELLKGPLTVLEPRWKPAPAEAAAWPPEIFVKVTASDGRSGWGSFSRH